MTPGQEDDLDLQRAVTELQAGIRTELNSRRIFDSYYPWLHRFFRHRGYAPQDCEDLAQETLFQVSGEAERTGSLHNPGCRGRNPRAGAGGARRLPRPGGL